MPLIFRTMLSRRRRSAIYVLEELKEADLGLTFLLFSKLV